LQPQTQQFRGFVAQAGRLVLPSTSLGEPKRRWAIFSRVHNTLSLNRSVARKPLAGGRAQAVQHPSSLGWFGLALAFPALLAACLILERFCAADDFHQLLGDRRLPRSIVQERVPGNHLLGISRRRIHGGHLRAEEARLALEEGAQNAYLYVHRHESLEQQLLVRLVEKVARAESLSRVDALGE